jgi:hypothetical protein
MESAWSSQNANHVPYPAQGRLVLQCLVIDIRTEAIGGVIQDLITPTKEEAA